VCCLISILLEVARKWEFKNYLNYTICDTENMNLAQSQTVYWILAASKGWIKRIFNEGVWIPKPPPGTPLLELELGLRVNKFEPGARREIGVL